MYTAVLLCVFHSCCTVINEIITAYVSGVTPPTLWPPRSPQIGNWCNNQAVSAASTRTDGKRKKKSKVRLHPLLCDKVHHSTTKYYTVSDSHMFLSFKFLIQSDSLCLPHLWTLFFHLLVLNCFMFHLYDFNLASNRSVFHSCPSAPRCGLFPSSCLWLWILKSPKNSSSDSLHHVRWEVSFSLLSPPHPLRPHSWWSSATISPYLLPPLQKEPGWDRGWWSSERCPEFFVPIDRMMDRFSKFCKS